MTDAPIDAHDAAARALVPAADRGPAPAGGDPVDKRLAQRLRARGMPRRFGPLLELFAGGALDRVRVRDEDAAMLRGFADAGDVVVYVHRARNPVEHLALSRAVARLQLPRARYVGGLNVGAYHPFWVLAARMRSPRAGNEEQLLEACVRAGAAAEIFLRRPVHLLSTTSGYRVRFMDVLVQAQRAMPERRIVLVPVFLALLQRPGHQERSALDAIFGTVEEPGLLRAVGRLLAAGDAARFEISEPVDLRRFLDEPDNQGATDAVVAKKVRWVLLHHLARVERVCHGPPMKSAARMRDDVLKDARLQEVIGRLHAEQGLPTALLDKKARAMHDEIAARFDVDLARLFTRILDVLFKRLYDGVVWDDAELSKVRKAGARGPIVLVPSHRSHVDYLVMSWLLLKSGMLPPLVAAGENLSFFPLGPLFRRGGAFFLRRSFKGDVLYTAVFRSYVRQLFAQGFTQEFFIEGGRSRTGKTLPPKLGLLSMLVDAYLESREDDAIFLPCHIAYEQVIEAGSYVSELGGKAKEKESAAALVKSASVLSERYGKVYVTFDEPLSLKEHLASRGIARDDKGDEGKRKAAVAALGHRIVYGINRAGLVTAVSLAATALFGFRKKAVDEALVLVGMRMLLEHLKRRPAGEVRLQAELATVDDPAPVFAAGVARLIEARLVRTTEVGGRKLLQIIDDKALVLDAQKNHVLHHFVPEAIVAAATYAVARKQGRSAPGSGVDGAWAPLDRGAVSATARELSRVLKLEFIFQSGVGFDELFFQATENAIKLGFLDESADKKGLIVPAGEAARATRRFAAHLILPFLEAYRVCLHALDKVSAANDKELVAALLAELRAQAITGDLRCPEAASKANVENAVAFCKDAGLWDAGKLVGGKRDEVARLVALLHSAAPR